MSTVSPWPAPSKEAAFLASLNNPPRERFYVIDPRGCNHSYILRDRANSLFVRTFRNGDDAHKEAKALNACPPAKRPLFPVSAVRITPAAPLIAPAKIEACWKCGEVCPSDGNADPLHCAKCRQEKMATECVQAFKPLADAANQVRQQMADDRRDAAVHTVTTLADAALVELAAAAADEIARRLHSAA